MKKFLFTTSVSWLHLRSRCSVFAVRSERIKELVWESEEKIVICRLKGGLYGKRLWPRSSKCFPRRPRAAFSTPRSQFLTKASKTYEHFFSSLFNFFARLVFLLLQWRSCEHQPIMFWYLEFKTFTCISVHFSNLLQNLCCDTFVCPTAQTTWLKQEA